MKEALCVKDLCKTFITNKRQNNVLKNVNFTIAEGEMVAVMDPLRFRQIHPFVQCVRHGPAHCRKSAAGRKTDHRFK